MNKFFGALFNIRYLAVLAVVGPFLGAVLMLLLGVTDVVNAYMIFFGITPPDGEVEAGEAAMITLVASVDHFLFATILMIFGVGIYALIFAAPAAVKGDSARKTYELESPQESGRYGRNAAQGHHHAALRKLP